MLHDLKLNNSGVMLEASRREYMRLMGEAKGAGEQSLALYRAAGAELRTAKAVCPYGSFGPLVAEWGCSRAWSGRLMKLDEHWAVWLKARAAALSAGETVQFSVDAALQLIKDFTRLEDVGHGAASRRSARKEKPNRQHLSRASLDKGDCASGLLVKLNAAKARIAFLETPQRSALAAETVALDVGTLARAKKVAALWYHGSTEGERVTAVARLSAVAQRHGLTFASLVKTIGFEL